MGVGRASTVNTPPLLLPPSYSQAAARIQADNKGHQLLSKMGWREGQGLGSAGAGDAMPVGAKPRGGGGAVNDGLGLGASNTAAEVTADDDPFEAYKKRMALGYRHRPNPLNNPRKAYY